MKPKTIIILVFIALLVVVLIQNLKIITRLETFRLFFWQISISLIILVPLMFIVGFILGFLVAKLYRQRKAP